MSRFCSYQRALLLAVGLISSCGCCQRNMCELPDGCSWGLDDCQWVESVKQVCRTGELRPLDRGDVVFEEECEIAWDTACGADCEFTGNAESCPIVREYLPPRLRKIQPGPPPVTYQPPMPPRFLPVPTRSVFSPVHSYVPTLANDGVEVGYGPQLALPDLE